MRTIPGALLLICFSLHAADWPTAAGNPQRDGWAKAETAFTKENVTRLELLYKYQGDDALTAPIVDGRLITYLGFKEMLVFGGSLDSIYSVDADLNRIIWKVRLSLQGSSNALTGACAGGMTAPVAMPGSSTAVVARGTAARPAPGAVVPVRRPNRGGEFYAVSSDGYLHVLNPSTGADRLPPVKFLPPNARVSALNVGNNVIYAATLDNCGGNADALYALDLSADGGNVVMQSAQEGRITGNAGTAIGNDGTVYAQSQNLHGDHNDGVFALEPGTLKVRDYFLSPNNVSEHVPGATPVVFSWKGADVVAAGGADGRMYLLDSRKMREPIFKSADDVTGAFRGTFASWENATGERWLYGSSPDKVYGWKVEDRGGKPVLTKAWVSPVLDSPSPPAVANGLVFALSARGLSVLDANTGRLLYDSGNVVTSKPRGSLAIANRRLYFTAQDHTVYCFGFGADQPQLTGR